MNTTTKIFILLAAMAAVFFVVMLSIRSLGTPPNIPKDDVYEAELDQYITNFKRYKTFDEADIPFHNNIRCAEIFYHENKIVAIRCNDFIDKVMIEYMRIFGGKWSESRFKSPWTETDIKEMRGKIENIEAVRHTDGTPAYNTYQKELDKLRQISDNYSSAKTLCGKFQFSNLKSAEGTARKINTYRNDEYLRNCKSLADGLDKALVDLHSSHYQYVRKRVDDLTYFVSSGAYKSKTKSFFDGVYLELANQALKDYEDNAKSLYGTISTTSQFKINIDNAVKEAYRYYYEQNPSLASGLSGSPYGSEGHHLYVDLGLSVKWATCNVGASSSSDYGYYFAWGETRIKSEYTANNINANAKSRTYDMGGISQFDAARAIWGGSWRLPSKAELEELAKCKWEWTSLDGHNGYKITGPNGKSIFLPAAGFKSGKDTNGTGVYGYYWCSTPDAGGAYGFVVCNGRPAVVRYNKHSGFSIRPVIK